ncbi:HAMP domain-containing histidine kinase [Candidatus Marinimicrobia bacterium]|jgi:energy-coupling factor transporter transmembrane protein EcfT|nr:HAMP domain-containing histidine kinase [Candidatus Neomarinimicrobiota bacterium]
MKLYKNAGNIKSGLFILGIIFVILLLGYTQVLVNELRRDNREVVRLYASFIANIVQDENETNLNFIFENVIKKVKFPLIQTDTNDKPQLWKNLPKNIHSDTDRIKFMKLIDKNNSPIPLIYKDANIGDITFGYLHYGDSSIVEKLKSWTYVILFSMGIFIFIGFLGFSFIRNNEKKHIWVGMARETAHQLGTPVSALMGWVDWLKDHPEKSNEILSEIELDLQRLEQISRRFSNMGSKPHFSEFDLSIKVEKIVEYLNKRLPSLGKKVELLNDIDPDIKINGNGSLLAWAIENIIRNGIDAIEREDGQISISLKQVNNIVKIQIHDNGIGIPKKDWKNIFRPGFSTKKTGWGLGLSLSTRIVEDIHNGSLSVASSSMKKGTIIQISL